MTSIVQIHTPEVPAVQTDTSTPMSIIHVAIERGASPDTLARLMDLQERFEANAARRAFFEAMAAAKAEIKPVIRNRKVDFTTPKGRTTYDYEDLAGIGEHIDPILAKHGLSYRYRTQADGSNIIVTCILSHRLGHTEETSLPGFRDDSGNKNAIQAIGSTVTYLQRYTLKSALGLAATKDTDGRAPEPPSTTIDEAQFRYLKDLIEKASADEARMLEYLKADSLEMLTQAQYRSAEAMLRKKMRQGGAKS